MFIEKELNWGPFFSIVIGVKSDLITIARKTDSIVDWLSNCGGFMEALKIIGYALVSSFNAYALKSTLAQNLVRFVPSKPKNSDLNAENKLRYRQEEFI